MYVDIYVYMCVSQLEMDNSVIYPKKIKHHNESTIAKMKNCKTGFLSQYSGVHKTKRVRIQT